MSPTNRPSVTSLNRRQVLRGMSLSVAGLPLLDHLTSLTALAADPPVVPRNGFPRMVHEYFVQRPELLDFVELLMGPFVQLDTLQILSRQPPATRKAVEPSESVTKRAPAGAGENCLASAAAAAAWSTARKSPEGRQPRSPREPLGERGRRRARGLRSRTSRAAARAAASAASSSTSAVAAPPHASRTWPVGHD